MITPTPLNFYLETEELRQRHEAACPPSEAYLFFPSEFQIIEFNAKTPQKTLRRIFESKTKEFQNYEEDKLKELESEITKYNSKNESAKLIFPSSYNTIEKRRYLQATGFDAKKTISLLIENIKWRSELIPPQMSNKVIRLLNCGFMYIHGRDNNYRPCLVLQVKVYMDLMKQYTYEEWLSSVIFFMEYVVNNLLIPGQVENWNIITDLNGVSIITLPSDMKKFMSILQANYRCRLYVNYIIGMGMFIRGIWALISSMLDETTVRKVRILSTSTMNEIVSFINPEQVEQKFGGTADNVIPGGNNIFPPVIPSRNFLTKDQDKETLLVSEGRYKELHQTHQLTVTNQYYLNKWKEEENLKERLLQEKLLQERMLKDEEDNRIREYEKSEQMFNTNVQFSHMHSEVYEEATPSSRGNLKLAQTNLFNTKGSFNSWVKHKNSYDHTTPEISTDLSICF